MKLGSQGRTVVGLSLLLTVVAACGGRQTSAVRSERGVEAALAAAGENRAELEHALGSLASDERSGLEFLLKHMPDRDIETLSSSFLTENVTLAFAAWRTTPWGRKTPRAVFHREVLPYACASEDREPWRRTLYEQLLPTVADCDTALEAIQRLNETVWEHFSIEYAGGRERVDQSPRQTIEMKVASCTGFALFLTAAARAVGIPSRMVAIGSWPHMAGNHTWLEVWDADGWHVVGAGEPDDYIDDVWLMDQTLHARRDEPVHAVYATSFACTAEWLPTRWARHRVFGTNVTDRYLAYGTDGIPR